MIIRADPTGEIKLGDFILPGVFQSLSVNGEIQVDSGGDGSSKPRKVMRGYNDKKISLSLILIEKEGSTVYQQLSAVEKVFRRENDNVPQIYTIVHDHIVARDIDQVLFQSLSSAEDNTTNTITLTLQFEEFIEANYS